VSVESGLKAGDRVATAGIFKLHNGIGVIESKAGIQTAASIQPVELQHAAILNFVLGQYPVPSAFAPVTGARTLADHRG